MTVLFFVCFFSKESRCSRPINVTEFGQILRTCIDLPKIVRHWLTFLIYFVCLDSLEIPALTTYFCFVLILWISQSSTQIQGLFKRIDCLGKGKVSWVSCTSNLFSWSIKSIKYIFPDPCQVNGCFCDQGRPVRVHAAGVQSAGRCCMPEEAGGLCSAGQDEPAGSRRSSHQRPSQPRRYRGHGRRGRGHLLLELWTEATEDQRCVCRFFKV